MTGEALTAGRELDALVAEKVMGIPVKRFHDGDWLTTTGENIEPYSTDIAAAWLVAEKLSVQWPVSVMKLPNNPSWQASIGMLGWIDGDTAEVAICLAALKALGVNPAP